MNRFFIRALTLLALLAIAGRAGAADATNAVRAKPAPVKTDTKPDFSSFKLITERNIFDMSRTGRRVRGAPVRTVKIDRFALWGTMIDERIQYAFFEGNSSSYGQNLKPGDSIAGYKITRIENDYIELTATNNQTIKMPVDSEMSRRDGGPWTLGTRSSGGMSSSDRSDRRSNRESRSSAGMSSDQKVEDAISGAGDDVIKRLMEKRAREESGK